jgi:hypothetical protein
METSRNFYELSAEPFPREVALNVAKSVMLRTNLLITTTSSMMPTTEPLVDNGY